MITRITKRKRFEALSYLAEHSSPPPTPHQPAPILVRVHLGLCFTPTITTKYETNESPPLPAPLHYTPPPPPKKGETLRKKERKRLQTNKKQTNKSVRIGHNGC